MKTRKHKADLIILFATLSLLILGLVVIYAIGPMRANVLNSAYGTNYDQNYFFFGQLRSVALALIAFFIAFKCLPYKNIRKYARVVMAIALLASLLLWILSLAGSNLVKCELGQCRWFSLGSVSFQPAELLKLALVIYLADYIARQKEQGTLNKVKEFWPPLLFIFGFSLALVVLAQGDLGTGVALIAIILGMLLASGISYRQFLIFLISIILIGVVAIATSSHRMERIEAWFATISEDEASDSTYHVDNAMLAVGVGGFFGVGVGNSVQATGYLPESINDSVFAIMGETFGFIGLTVVIMVFAALLLRMLKVAEGVPSQEERLFIVGVFSWTLAQVVVNIMAMIGLIPVTGITLPLLSYGGTSMIFIAFAIGLVLQLSCYTSREGIKEDENISSRRGLGRAYHSSRRRSS